MVPVYMGTAQLMASASRGSHDFDDAAGPTMVDSADSWQSPRQAGQRDDAQSQTARRFR
jgi:hypothetical protein